MGVREIEDPRSASFLPPPKDYGENATPSKTPSQVYRDAGARPQAAILLGPLCIYTATHLHCHVLDVRATQCFDRIQIISRLEAGGTYRRIQVPMPSREKLVDLRKGDAFESGETL